MPSKPKLFAFNKEVIDNLGVSAIRPEEFVEIKCVASNGIPPPNFYWKINDRLILNNPTIPSKFIHSIF